MFLVLVVISLILYLFAPQNYDFAFCCACAILYGIIYYLAVRRDFSEKRYVSFNIIFLFFLFVSSFIVPLFLKSTSSFLDVYINKGTALVTLAASVYNLGWQRSVKSVPVTASDLTVLSVPHYMKATFNALCIVVLLIYIVLLSSFMKTIDNQTNDFDIVFFVLILQAVLTTTLLINILSKRNHYHSFIPFVNNSLIVVLSFAFVTITFLSFGDRTTPLYLVLVFVSTYGLFVKRIRFPAIILGSIMALVIMFTIGQTRISSRDHSENNSIVARTQTTVSNTSSIVDYFSDFTPASSSLYMSLNYVNSNNTFYYPAKIIITIISPIPFIPSILSEAIFNVPNSELSSGYLTTSQYDSKIGSLNGGLGTHCVGDIYLSWGLIGVILAFFFLGRIMGVAQINCPHNIYWATIYISMLGNSIYMSRATLFDSYRLIVFELFLIWLIKRIRVK